MKKTLLASAILAGLVSATAQAATVYEQDGTSLDVIGGAEVVAVSKDSIDGTLGHDNFGYIGLSGSSKVSDTVTAYADFVIETDDVDAGTFAVDDLIVGFDTAYGDFSFGGTDSALGQVSDISDIGAYHGGIQEFVEGKGATGFGYANTFAGLTVNAEFIASSAEDADSIGLSAVYSLDFGLDLGAGYVVLDDANELALALGYSIGDFYLGLGYADGEDTTGADYTSIEVAAQYAVTDALTVTALLGQAETDDVDTTDYYVVDASYAINDSVVTYASFQADNLDGATDDSEIVVGVAYDF